CRPAGHPADGRVGDPAQAVQPSGADRSHRASFVNREVAERVAGRFESRLLRSYARTKLRTDPVYRAVFDRLRDSNAPLFDIGCGVGLLEFYLRECGFDGAITAIDHDERKIAKAREIGQHYENLEFALGDARDPIAVGRVV